MRWCLPTMIGLLYLSGCPEGVLHGPGDARVDARGDALAPHDLAGAEAPRVDAWPDGQADAPSFDALPDAPLPDAAAIDALPIDAKPVDTAPAQKSGTIVPLYTYPTHASWNTIVQAKQAHPSVPVVAIVNSNNGPGSSQDPSYTTGIDKLVTAGILVIGYVYTSYAARPQATVKSDMDAWKSWYPKIGGIFFDEQSNTAGGESYYSSLSSYAKSKGMSFTVGNPGTDTVASYVGTVDAILIYESAGLPSIASLQGWHAQHDKKNFGIIPYAVAALDASFVASARQHVGYIYITDDTLPNPWDSLPAYFGALVTDLDK